MRFVLILVFISFGLNLTAQKLVVDNSGFFYQVAPLFEFKKGVVSLTFDDGSKNQFEIGMPMLKEKGLPATFYLITSHIDTAINSLISKHKSPEFEFGSHTSTHPDLIQVGSVEDKKEFNTSQIFLKSNFGVNAGLTMSYPWGRFDNSVKQIAKDFYLAARSTGPGYNSFYHLDRYALKVQSFDRHTDFRKANSWVFSAIRNNSWLVEMIHGISDGGYSPVDSSALSAHLDFIVDSQNEIWCSTVSNVIKYLDEAKNTLVECNFCTDSVYNIRADDFLDDSLYDQPLTLKIKIPSYWEEISIPGTEKFRIDISNKNKFVIFNLLPDNTLHSIRPIRLSVPEEETGMKIVYLSANPFSDLIKFTIELFESADVDITLTNLLGHVLIHQKEKSINGVINLNFDTSVLANGVYFLIIQSEYKSVISRKMIKVK